MSPLTNLDQFPPGSNGVEVMIELAAAGGGQGAAQHGKGHTGNPPVSETLANPWSESRDGNRRTRETPIPILSQSQVET